MEIKLTQFSHGSGCGCKVAPAVLEEILRDTGENFLSRNLLVGNETKDDAAVYDLGNGTALISTVDFFTPIVDDPYDFGKVASANAISDIYAMGGKPILAIAILGWPVEKLPVEEARKILEGSRMICKEAGIPLAGGHSIDSQEPIFGLAVNGMVALENIKQNNKAQEGDVLFLTKPLGVGILTTAEKKSILKEEHKDLAANQMMQLNKVGEALGKLACVTAMTDVTGFGLLGHLTEMAEGSNLSAIINFADVPVITPSIFEYIAQGSVPGGTTRNRDSYAHKIGTLTEEQWAILADPQTSGGLLIAVNKNKTEEVVNCLKENGFANFIKPIGFLKAAEEKVVNIV